MAVFIFVVVMPQDVATHTAHAVLSSAAFADFQSEVVRRQSMGDDMGAVRLWTRIRSRNQAQALGLAADGPPKRAPTA